jgi:hypothetical protein
MDIVCQGSDWDERRRQTRYFAQLDNGEEFEGLASTVADARLVLRDALAAAGHPLEQLGGLAASLREEIQEDEENLRRCPGGRALDPCFDYALAFEAGRPISVEFLEGPSAGVIAVEEAGVLSVPSGRIAAYDPLTSQREAFAFHVPPGDYRVLVSLAEIEGEPRRRTIAAAVRFSDAPAVLWRQALLEDEDPRDLAPREMFGYGVDSGTGCFADANADPSELGDPGIEEYEQLAPDLIAFTTGWGDGNYASFLGFDAQGKPAMLVTDFALLTSLP